MGKEHELLVALRGGNVDQARKIMAKLKKAGWSGRRILWSAVTRAVLKV